MAESLLRLCGGAGAPIDGAAIRGIEPSMGGGGFRGVELVPEGEQIALLDWNYWSERGGAEGWEEFVS